MAYSSSYLQYCIFWEKFHIAAAKLLERLENHRVKRSDSPYRQEMIP
jgi:hypothetical protein